MSRKKKKLAAAVLRTVPQEILVAGSAEVGSVEFENDGELYFRPTCVAAASLRQFYVKNTSRIPLQFEWKMSSADAKLLSVSPPSGVIPPGEKQVKFCVHPPPQAFVLVLRRTFHTSLQICQEGSFKNVGERLFYWL